MRTVTIPEDLMETPDQSDLHHKSIYDDQEEDSLCVSVEQNISGSQVAS